MITLINYLSEYMIVESGVYNIQINLSDAKDTIHTLFNSNNIPENIFNEFIHKLESAIGSDAMLKKSDVESNNVLKIPRMYTDAMQKEFKQGPFIMSGDNIRYGKIILAIMGNGSSGKKVQTENQEWFTTLYYNTPDNMWDDIDDYFINDVSGDLAAGKLWVASFHQQVAALKKKLGDGFRAVRIGDIKKLSNFISELSKRGINADMNSDDKKILTIYDKLANNYKNVINKMENFISDDSKKQLRRDVYDKSDIIIYNESKMSDIESTFNKLNDPIDTLAVVQSLFSNKLLMGVSLKGLKNINGSYKILTINNPDGEVDPDDVLIDKCDSYHLDGLLTRNTDNMKMRNNIELVTYSHRNKYIFTFRSYGKNNGKQILSGDVKLNNNPVAFGKLSSTIIRNFVNKNIGRIPMNIKKLSPQDLTNQKTVNDIYDDLRGSIKKVFGEEFDNYWPDRKNRNIICNSPEDINVLCIQLLYIFTKLNPKDILDTITDWLKISCAEDNIFFPFFVTKEV